MSINPELDRLARLIQSERERLLSRWHQQVRALPSAQCLDGYDIEEVVAEYNLLRGCIHDLAQGNGLILPPRQSAVAVVNA